MKNFFSFILISIFSLVFTIALFSFDLKSVFLNPTSVKAALASNNAYGNFVDNVLPSIIVQSVKDSAGNSEQTNALAKNLAKTLLDAKSLQTDVEYALDGVLPYLSGDKKDLNLEISLSKYRTALETNFEPTFISFFSTLPVCISENLNQETEGIPSCRPKNLSADQLYRQIPARDIKTVLLDRLPTQIQITEEKATFVPTETAAKQIVNDAGSENSLSFKTVNLKAAHETMQKVTLAIWAGFGVSLLSLLLVVALWWKNYRASLKWISGAFFSVSVLPFLTSLTIIFFLKKELLLKALDSVVGLPKGVDFSFAIGVVISLLHSFAFLLIFETSAMIVIAIGINIFLHFHHPDKKIELPKTS